jgi:ADP-ribose pyrophosphatase YjhB (NUDIX family)
MYKAYVFLGRVLFVIALPAIRLVIKHTNRGYVAIRVDDEILLVKNWLARDTWRLPGGGYNPKKETSLQAVVREVSEELSVLLEKEDAEVLYKGVHATDRLNFAYTLYEVKLAHKPRLKVQSSEITDHAWMHIDELSGKSLELTKVAKYLRRT